MVIRSKLPAWSIALCLTVTVMAPSGSRQVRADPLADSFASGGKRPAHKPATKPATRPTTKPTTRPTAKPAVKSGGSGTRGARVRPDAHRPSSGKTRVRDDELAGPPSSDTESRAAEREDAAAPSEPSRRTNRESDATRPDENDTPRSKKAAPRNTAVTKSTTGKKKAKARGDESDEPAEEPKEEEAGDKDEDEEGSDEGASFASLPSIVPRAVTFGLGASLMGRNFQFGAPAMLQHESSFPRLGFVVDLETFPLLLVSSRWWRLIGLGAFYASEPSGEASVNDPASGASINTPVKQGRWGIDLRMAIPIGERLVVTPRLGVQGYSFTLATKMPIMASSCTAAMTMACLPDTGVQTLAVGGIARIGASPDLGFSVAAAYLVGLGVTNRPVNQIGYEIGTSVIGFALEAGATWRLTSWMAVRALVPVTRLGYVFHPSTSPPTSAAVTYRSATELLYGISVGVAVFTK
jgi:hypothetical protein